MKNNLINIPLENEFKNENNLIKKINKENEICGTFKIRVKDLKTKKFIL